MRALLDDKSVKFYYRDLFYKGCKKYFGLDLNNIQMEEFRLLKTRIEPLFNMASYDYDPKNCVGGLIENKYALPWLSAPPDTVDDFQAEICRGEEQALQVNFLC